MIPNNKLIENDLCSLMIENVTLYQELIGRSQFSHRPTALHLKYAKQVIQYLLNTKHLKLAFIKSSGDNKLTAYFDSDFTNSSDRKSISGSAIYHGESLIYRVNSRTLNRARSYDSMERKSTFDIG